MRHIRRATAVLAVAAGLAGALVTAHSAGAAAASGCQYKVVWPTAGVYEEPDPNSPVVKTKHAGDIVGASTCEGGGVDDWGFVLVASDAAADGRGWIREEAVVQI
jgi:hypothetical protein